MVKRAYDIVMETPLGRRCGTLFLKESCGVLEGAIDILQHKNTVHGVIDELGACKLWGTLLALVYTVEFCAVGVANENGLWLKLRTAENWQYQIHGVPVLPKKGQKQ